MHCITFDQSGMQISGENRNRDKERQDSVLIYRVLHLSGCDKYKYFSPSRNMPVHHLCNGVTWVTEKMFNVYSELKVHL